MNLKHTGAFPKPDHEDFIPQDGLTKREYFIAMAMQGMIVKEGVELTDDYYKYSIERVISIVDELFEKLES